MQIDNGATLYKQTNSDSILAVGGGSPIDSAKAIGIVVSNGGSIRDYEAYDSVVNTIPPVIAIPTTAGTGCEVSAWAVITNTRKNYKFCPGGARIIPKIALVDPELTVSMPPGITAATGMDALSHAIEAICSPYAMPQTDAYAFSAIRLVVKHLGSAVAMGEDITGLSKQEAAGKASAAVLELQKSFGLPTSLSACNADPTLIKVCAKWAMTDTSIPGNPRELTQEQVEALFKKAFEG